MSGQPAAPAAPAALAPSFTADQFQQLMAGFANNATRQAKTFTAPRVGGTNSTGVWTGMGSDGAGTAPKSANCYRGFDADVIKNHTAMTPIEVKCSTGLKDSPELLFSTNEESNAGKVVPSLYAFKDSMVNCGMEGVFNIVQADGTKVNMLTSPGMVTTTMVGTWCDDLLTNGVHDPIPTSGHLPVCLLDGINMRWSGEALLNSCTETLKQDLKLAV